MADLVELGMDVNADGAIEKVRRFRTEMDNTGAAGTALGTTLQGTSANYERLARSIERGLKIDATRNEALTRAAELERNLQRELAAGSLEFDQRVRKLEQLNRVQAALAQNRAGSNQYEQPIGPQSLRAVTQYAEAIGPLPNKVSAVSSRLAVMASQFKITGAEAGGAHGGVGRLNDALITVTRTTTGLPPLVGKMIDVFGTLAIGAGGMIPILAGATGVAWALGAVGQASRDASADVQEVVKYVNQLDATKLSELQEQLNKIKKDRGDIDAGRAARGAVAALGGVFGQIIAPAFGPSAADAEADLRKLNTAKRRLTAEQAAEDRKLDAERFAEHLKQNAANEAERKRYSDRIVAINRLMLGVLTDAERKRLDQERSILEGALRDEESRNNKRIADAKRTAEQIARAEKEARESLLSVVATGGGTPEQLARARQEYEQQLAIFEDITRSEVERAQALERAKAAWTSIRADSEVHVAAIEKLIKRDLAGTSSGPRVTFDGNGVATRNPNTSYVDSQTGFRGGTIPVFVTNAGDFKASKNPDPWRNAGDVGSFLSGLGKQLDPRLILSGVASNLLTSGLAFISSTITGFVTDIFSVGDEAVRRQREMARQIADANRQAREAYRESLSGAFGADSLLTPEQRRQEEFRRFGRQAATDFGASPHEQNVLGGGVDAVRQWLAVLEAEPWNEMSEFAKEMQHLVDLFDQAEERAKAAAEAERARQAATFNTDVLGIELENARHSGDPNRIRAAIEAAGLDENARRLADAEKLRNEGVITQEAFERLREAVGERLRNALDDAAKAAEEAARAEEYRRQTDMGSLEVRKLMALDQNEEAQRKRDELEILAAINDKKDDAYIALLKEIQGLEAAKRAREAEAASAQVSTHETRSRTASDTARSVTGLSEARGVQLVDVTRLGFGAMNSNFSTANSYLATIAQAVTQQGFASSASAFGTRTYGGQNVVVHVHMDGLTITRRARAGQINIDLGKEAESDNRLNGNAGV